MKQTVDPPYAQVLQEFNQLRTENVQEITTSVQSIYRFIKFPKQYNTITTYITFKLC